MEIWRDIPKYEGKYQVSSCGRVKSLNYLRTGKERILKQRYHKDGYKIITLNKNNEAKTYGVHKLVAMAFIENPNNLLEINHKDECKYNNYVENLEWCTHEYNINYGTRTERQSKTLSKTRTGKHHTEEIKSKISKTMTCKYIGENHPNAKKVQASTGEIFDTVTEAAKWSGTCKSDIAKQIQGKRKTTGKHPVTKEKLQWKYI